MSIKNLSANALLASLLFVIYFSLSQILYLEFVTFTIILLSLNIPKYNSLFIITTFVILIWLVYGISLWSLMYIIIYPLFTIILLILKKPLKKNVYFIAIFAFFMGLLVGNMIDLPFLLFSKEITVMYILLGFKTTLIQGTIAFITVILFYDTLSKLIQQIIKKGDLYV